MISSALLSTRDWDAWNRSLERSRIPSSQRLYFRREYSKLCAEAVDGEGHLFSYESNGEYFLFPVITRAIPGTTLYDFESPYGYSGVFSTSTDRDFLDHAWEAFKSKLNAAGVIAGFVRFNPLATPFTAEFFPDYLKYFPSNEIVYLDLNRSEAEIFDQYESSVRTNIRKARKSGVTAEEDPTGNLEPFRKIYLSTMDRVDAKEFYRFDEKYFREFESGLKDAYRVIYAKDEGGTIVAGILIFFSGDVATIHLSGCRDEYLKLGVPSLLRHEAILWSKRKGLAKINFGGGKSADPNCSLLKFKSGFSRQRAQYYIGTCLLNESEYRELCNQWKKSHPGEEPKYFLKYRLS